MGEDSEDKNEKVVKEIERRKSKSRKKQEKTDWFCIVFEAAGIIAN